MSMVSGFVRSCLKSTKLALLLVASTLFMILLATSASWASNGSSTKVVTVYDEDTETTIVTAADTVQSALKDAGIKTSQYDSISPALNEKIKAANSVINVRRARPILVIDGQRKVRTITATQSNEEIVRSAGITLYPEDATKLSQVSDLLTSGGAGLQLTITRAKVVNLELYGQNIQVRTQAKTVADLLKEKGIKLEADDDMDLAGSTDITDQMTLRIWRNGIQTINITEELPFSTEKVYDPNYAVGYSEVKTPGQVGQKSVIYQIEIADGQEINRSVISEVVSSPPVNQVVIVGIKAANGLTKAKGAQYFVDSKGVSHRETYYDLNMSVVMNSCGQNGKYIVRVDGVKVDNNGYVIVAANLSRYPRCSVVETSLGPGKVYDTGGFAAVHPDGFDIATDWSNNNGV